MIKSCKIKKYKKGSILIETIVAVVIFLLCSTTIINLSIKNSILIKEVKHIEKDINAIHSLLSLNIKEEILANLSSNGERTCYLVYDDNMIKNIFFDLKSYLITSKPSSNNYIEFSMEKDELFIKLFGGVHGKNYILTKRVKS